MTPIRGNLPYSLEKDHKEGENNLSVFNTSEITKSCHNDERQKIHIGAV